MEQGDNGSAGEASPRRSKRSPEQWRALVAAQPSSGLAVEQYCRRHELTSSCFYRWRRFLTGTTGTTSPWASSKRRRLPPVQGFAAVHVAQNPKPRPLQDESIRLRLAGGWELILPASMPTGRLVELLVALESKPCGRERDT
jgi:transposase-like protein